MNNKSLYIALVDPSITFVAVRFHDRERGEFSGKTYTYKTDITNIAVGDVVVCEAAMWYAVGTVIETNIAIPMDDTNTAYRWIVDVVATADHKERLRFENDLAKEINNMRARSLRERVLNEMGLSPDAVTRVIGLAREHKDDTPTVDAVVVDDGDGEH